MKINYNFDEIIDREGTNSISYEGWKKVLLGKRNKKGSLFKESDYIRLWIADMDFATPPEIIEAIKQRLDRKILGYSAVFDSEYYSILRDWFLKRYQWEINLKDLVISPGVVPALNRLVGLLTTEYDGVLINTPSYEPFKTAADINKRRVFYSRLLHTQGRYEIDFEDFIDQLNDKDKNIRLFILCNPHNPTGRVWTEEELRKIGETCLERNIWIISDEIHSDILRKNEKHIPLAKLFPNSKRIITCTAPSKTFNLAGNLMSHIFIPDKAIRDQWKALHFDLLSPLSIEAVKAAYGKCENWLEQVNEYIDDNFLFLDEQLKDYLPEVKFIIPESTYLAWINISPYLQNIRNDDLSQHFAEKAGVIVDGGSKFVGNSEGYIRLNIACPRSVLAEGLKRIFKVLLHNV